MSRHRPEVTVAAVEQASAETRKAWEDLVASGVPLLEAPAPSPDTEAGQKPVKVTAAPVPLQRPVGDCLGKMVECPQCGKPMEVCNARGARTATQVVSSIWWVLCKCQGSCGSVLRRVAEVVTVLPESIPVPVVKPLGAVVGRTVLCPGQVRLPDGSSRPCGRQARASWDFEMAHSIVCPDCGAVAYPGSTEVEVVS